MTIPRRISLISAIGMTACLSHAGSQQFDHAYVKNNVQNFDNRLLIPLVDRAQESFNKIDAFCSDISTGKKYIYRSKKHALKTIRHELKKNAQDAIKIDLSAGNDAQVLYKAFKQNVYKSWKKNQTLPVIQ